MKKFLFVINSIFGTDGEREVGRLGTNIELSIEARDIGSAMEKFNKQAPRLLKDGGYTYFNYNFSTFLDNPDTGRKYLQTFGSI